VSAPRQQHGAVNGKDNGGTQARVPPSSVLPEEPYLSFGTSTGVFLLYSS